MDRVPKKRKRRILGSRSYKDYSDELLKTAVEMVGNKKMSSRDAEKYFGIPRRTICNKVKGLHTKIPGAPQRLTEEEENKIAEVLIAVGDFGSPVSLLEIRMIVFDYLKQNNREYLFGGKPPGEWWVHSFLKRNQSKLTIRSTQNVKRVRAEKNPKEMMEYFENLRITLKDVPPTNILNFDETNLTDDPGSSKCIFKRGIKYPERVLNYTKGSISIMFSVTADGKCLPPYIVYKANKMWEQWRENGPVGARYNRSKSGWFNAAIFEDYFRTIVIPWSETVEGPVVLIGDNLASHYNVAIFDLCAEKNIRFTFLPPNSTHLTQPLDVAFFGPLKRIWRQILLDYKIKNPKETTVSKCHFPALLKKLIESVEFQENNIKSGFRACGIHPYNPDNVLKRLPDHMHETKYNIDDTLLNYLKENRSPNPMKKPRLKKIIIPPGMSVTSCSGESQTALGLEPNSQSSQKQQKTAKNKNKSNTANILDEKTGKFLQQNEITNILKTEKIEFTEKQHFTQQTVETEHNSNRFLILDEKTGVFNDKSDFGRYSKNSTKKIKIISSVLIKKSDSEADPLACQPNALTSGSNFQLQSCLSSTRKFFKKNHAMSNISTSDSSDVDTIKFNDSSDYNVDDDDNISLLSDHTYVNNDEKPEQINCSEKTVSSTNDVKAGSYVLARFVTNKKEKCFVGKILSIDDQTTVTAKFLRKKANGTFHWPNVEDIAAVYVWDLIKLLPEPVNKRGLLRFSVNLDTYRVE